MTVRERIRAILTHSYFLCPDEIAAVEWLASVDVENEESIAILVTYLSATLWCNRAMFAARVRARLNVLDPERIDVLLSGLNA